MIEYLKNILLSINLHSIFLVACIFLGIISLWGFYIIFQYGQKKLFNWAQKNNYTTLSVIIPNIQNSFYILFILLLSNLMLPLFKFKENIAFYIDKAAQILLISMIGFLCYQLTNIFVKVISVKYINQNTDIFSARKLNTQILILKRIVYALILLVTLAAILMLFDAVNTIGKGLLTTAGIISAIGVFASQQSLTRIFAGLQIAFSQPFRIGDTIIVENEAGEVMEISLSYIVIKLWDLRTLILPTDYFTNKGVQNLTRDSSQSIGTVFFYADYTLPIEEVREKYFELLEAHPLWDKKESAFDLTNINEAAIELRGVMSAENAGDLWKLRCYIREKIMQYIVKNFPESLTHSRIKKEKI